MAAGLTKRFAFKVELVRLSGTPLQRMLEIEACGDWPGAIDAYRDELDRYAGLLRGTLEEQRACQTELMTLVEQELGGLLLCRDEAERSARLDAYNLLVSDTDGLAEAMVVAKGSLTEERRPNMVSFLRAKLIWRANDILESETRRHVRRVMVSANPIGQVPPDAQDVREADKTRRRVLILQVIKAFGEDDPSTPRILRGLMEGESIAELARRTGQSRQQIYRLLRRIREWIVRNGG